MIELSRKPLIRAFNMDCMQFMADLPDKAYDLAIVDPPYGIGVFRNSPWSKRPYNKGWNIKWNNKCPEFGYFNELYRISKNAIIWGVNYYGKYVRESGRLFWDKLNSSGIGSDGEIASQFKDKRVVKITLRNTGFCGPEKGQKIHPCQKPVSLYRWLLANYAKRGQTILDTHGGSFSSAIACWHEDFDMDIIELDNEYFDAACERFDRETRQLKLFGERA